MRENKYRAWDEDVEIMLYSDQEYDDYCFGFDKGKVVCWGKEEVVPSDPMEAPYFVGKPIENVMQFTGKLDKNKKEIFKGDKLKCSMGVPIGQRNERYEEVVVKSGCPCNVFPNGQLYIDDIVQAEIIGDIHTTPALMENGK